MKKLPSAMALVFTAFFSFGAGVFAASSAHRDAKEVAPEQQSWAPLSPRWGDKGPLFTPVLGDMKTKGTQAFIMKVPADFRPGLHTHAADYYGLVLEGRFHNYAAGAADEGPAMVPGTWWMQPGGSEYPHDNHCEAGAPCKLLILNTDGFSFQPAKK